MQGETYLRIDKGYLRVRWILVRHFTTIIAVIAYYIYSERIYFSLFNGISVILIDQSLKTLWVFFDLFHFYFLNSDI